MGIGPYRPIRELEAAIERGELDIAVGIAKDYTREHGRPLPTAVAVRLLPLVAAQQHSQYDRWACRWLQRWLTETSGATIEQAAEVAATLADLPAEPAFVDNITDHLGG
jgi:hypothetical protein